MTLTYVSVNNTVEISDSGRVSIKTDTVLLRPIDKGTVAIDLTMGFGSLPIPGANPSFSATAQVFHRDPTTGDDDVSALFGKSDRRCSPNSSGSTGDQHDFSFK